MKYHIHDNGGRPFLVELNTTTGIVYVYKRIEEEVYSGDLEYSIDPIKTFTAKQIFIGKSPLNKMTKFSGGHGKKFDGNSILLHIDDYNYVFIGQNIFSFKASGKIIKYESPVGNSDVPYPYAIDENGKTYLMIEDVVLDNFKPNSVYDDPYDYYYHYSLITPKFGFIPPRQPVVGNPLNIIDFFIGNSQYTLTYEPHPAINYKRLVSESEEAMYIITKDSPEKKVLSKEEYIKLMKDFGKANGFSLMKNMKILVKREW